MKTILGYVLDYWRSVDKRILFITSFFLGIGIFINYYNNINHKVGRLGNWQQYLFWYLVFLTAFSFPYFLYAIFRKHPVFRRNDFLFLLFLAPLLFSWKMVYDIDLKWSDSTVNNSFLNAVIYWPFKLAVISIALLIIWKLGREKQPFYGISTKNFSATPYLLMLLIMIPLIAAASTQHDFLAMYPKLKNLSYLKSMPNNGLFKILFELSYGSDFITIELFFRGFLVLAFCKWFGKDAILPMAVFYCTIHFGKPVGECISSFFGGLILGVVVYHTRTILGGLIVHLGIAWMMELGGYLGNILWG
ncbi:MAG: CPBP family intramembrane glutamic endopeptidase [Flavisolibacter sp.]